MQVIQKETMYRDTVVVRLQGNVDSVPLVSALHGPVKAKQHIILNLHAVTDFSSIHVGNLLIARRQLDSINRRLLLVAVPKHVNQIMSMSGCSGHFETYDSEADAIDVLKDRPVATAITKGGEINDGQG